jgi:hypothetical protein
VAGRELEAAAQKLHAFGELAEVHMGEAQVVEVFGIIPTQRWGDWFITHTLDETLH